eukprot:TRINITY_DN25119_c0_g1_i1.p1 TRINITY_DN25119_c0_g1~~TRINITY_DN25119_c0_g1_i1.p1  ORF type:complete len:330 (+),score=94.47 TRINITY_DN25119_c0_g1_i1:117-1106(+)
MATAPDASDIPVENKRARLGSVDVVALAMGMTTESVMEKINAKMTSDGKTPLTKEDLDSAQPNKDEELDDMNCDGLTSHTDAIREVKAKLRYHDVVLKELFEDVYRNRIRAIAKAGMKPKDWQQTIAKFKQKVCEYGNTAMLQESRNYLDIIARNMFDVKKMLADLKAMAVECNADRALTSIPPYSPENNQTRLVMKIIHKAAIRATIALLGLDEEHERLPKEFIATTYWPLVQDDGTTYKAAMEIQQNKVFCEVSIDMKAARVFIQTDGYDVKFRGTGYQMKFDSLRTEIVNCWTHAFDYVVADAKGRQLQIPTKGKGKGKGKAKPSH